MTQQYEKLPGNVRRFVTSDGTTISLGTGEGRTQLRMDEIQSINPEGSGGRVLLKDQRKFDISREDLPDLQAAYAWAQEWRREHAAG